MSDLLKNHEITALVDAASQAALARSEAESSIREAQNRAGIQTPVPIDKGFNSDGDEIDFFMCGDVVGDESAVMGD